jgi:hypothetical protein
MVYCFQKRLHTKDGGPKLEQTRIEEETQTRETL